MSPTEIISHLRRQPFEPFRICVSDGSVYDVPHPEFVLVTRTNVAIALKLSEGELPDRTVYCDPIHITRILPWDEARSKSNGVN